MSSADQLDDLLLRWEELQQEGSPVSIDEICAEHPGLRDELARRITALQSMAWLDDASSVLNPTKPIEPTSTFLRPGHEPVAGYRLLSRLGKGGFGEVWKAIGPGGFEVALKFIPRSDPAAELEARSLNWIKTLRHPHLLSTFAAWTTNDFLILGMELADGTLFDRWNAARKERLVGIPRDELLEYFRQAAEGIDYLNQSGAGHGLQHRDIKPQNLLLVGGSVKVGDFGLSRMLTHSTTGHTGNCTVAFAAAESFAGKTSKHSDQYSLAVTWCLLRGGRLPFSGSSAQVVAGHLGRRPDLLMLDRDERRVIARALNKNPRHRWPNCRTLVESLKHPPSLRRRRILQAAGATAAAMCLTGGATWYSLRQRPRLIRTFQAPGEMVGPGAVRDAIVLPDGQTLATNGGGRPRLWNCNTGEVIRTFGTMTGAGVDYAEGHFGPLMVTGHEDGSVLLWNSGTGENLMNFTGCGNAVTSVAFSRDSHTILASCCDQLVHVWHRDTGAKRFTLAGHNAIVTGATFFPSGLQAASVSWDGTMRIWDLERGTEIAKHVVSAHDYLVAVDVKVLNRNRVLAAIAGNDRNVYVWNLDAGEELFCLQGHTTEVQRVKFSHGCRWLASGEGTGRVILWETATGKQIWDLPGIGPSACGLAWSGDLRYLYVGSEMIRQWELPNLHA